MEIASEFNLDKKVIEKKIRSFVGPFNRECKSKSGAGADESSKWFAFKKLMFLKGKNIPSSAVDGGLQSNEENGLTKNRSDSENTLSLIETENTVTVNETTGMLFASPKPFRKRRLPVEKDTTQQEAVKFFVNICL
ncbi:unnamed protein product [Parnassius mnemosyne]|uniref:MADF domain-containing protein n=1 Tax=Parnassius mnemosyne TaxID=213953 RepID=A0AAV1KWT5_9NEOP